ncbi:MAG: hypothetical protein IJX38_05615 [Clostridia bacterium]|nr:hypothetical protein [Clostridia bacterium]
MIQNEKRHGGVSRIIALFMAIMLTFVVVTFGLASCGDGESDSEGNVTVVVAVGDDVRRYEIDLANIEDGTSAVALLDYLEAEGELDYEMSGTFLTKVGHLEQNADAGVYVGVWTSVEQDYDVSGYFGDVEYDGMTLVASGFGIMEMHYTDGCTIYFGEMIYG